MKLGFIVDDIRNKAFELSVMMEAKLDFVFTIFV